MDFLNQRKKYKVNCMLCGEELAYGESYEEVTCVYCKNRFNSNVTCKNGHYVCDSCHSLKGVGLILTYCKNTDKTNPIEIAVDIMKSKNFYMHGPEHHFLVPATLITSYYNNIGETSELKEKGLLIAKKRAEDIKGGFCGFYGNCGAAVGTGIFMSIITSTTPLTKKTWGITNEITGRSLIKISELGGPRCCKRNLFTAIRQATEFVDKKLNVKLYDYEDFKIVCDFSKLNSECIGKECPYNLYK